MPHPPGISTSTSHTYSLAGQTLESESLACETSTLSGKLQTFPTVKSKAMEVLLDRTQQYTPVHSESELVGSSCHHCLGYIIMTQ